MCCLAVRLIWASGAPMARRPAVPAAWASVRHTFLPSLFRFLQPTGSVTHVVDEGAAADMDVLAVQSILEEEDNVLALRVLGVEALGPSEEGTAVNGSLLDREAGQKCQPTSCVYRTMVLSAAVYICVTKRSLVGTPRGGGDLAARERQRLWRRRRQSRTVRRFQLTRR